MILIITILAGSFLLCVSLVWILTSSLYLKIESEMIKKIKRLKNGVQTSWKNYNNS